MPIIARALALSFLASLLARPALAQSAPAAPAPATSGGVPAQSVSDDIVVTGLLRPLTMSAKEFARAVKAHRELHLVYAPQSRLIFQVRAAAGADGRGMENLKLTFRSKNGIVPVAIDADNRFTLPALPGKGWKLVANRRRGFGILPLVLSPGTGDADRLLGDLRLQCEVLWAMAKPDLSILMRAAAGALGGFCRGSVLPFFEWSDRAIADASVSTGALTRSVYVTEDRHAYRAPVYDKTLPHSARVRLRYR